ncbi:MAG: zf-HC2 domain-containing protein [Anaerolineae bacterium]|nr:zf-HC2 domain-containing protein [Anaerolineae bacterium]
MNMVHCETIQEWMSLAQDGQLGSAESHRMHEHLMTCPACKAQWNAIMALSQVFHAAPMVGPQPGFMLRLQARMAYREEQRRRAMVAVLLAIGVIALLILALPSILSVVGLTGQLLLPRWIVVYVQGTLGWLYMILSSLSDAAWLLLRYFAASSGGTACLVSIVAAAACMILWVPLMMRRMATHTAK